MLMSSMTCPPQVMTGPAQTHDLSTYRYGISCWKFPKAHTQGGVLWRCLHLWLCLGLRHLWAKALDTGGCFLVGTHSHNYSLRRLQKWVSLHSICKMALRASGLTNALYRFVLHHQAHGMCFYNKTMHIPRSWLASNSDLASSRHLMCFTMSSIAHFLICSGLRRIGMPGVQLMLGHSVLDTPALHSTGFQP